MRRIAMERIDFDHLAANGTPGTLDAPEPAARAYVGASSAVALGAGRFCGGSVAVRAHILRTRRGFPR